MTGQGNGGLVATGAVTGQPAAVAANLHVEAATITAASGADTTLGAPLGELTLSSNGGAAASRARTCRRVVSCPSSARGSN